MPTALIDLAECPLSSNDLTAPSMQVSMEVMISRGSCSCHLLLSVGHCSGKILMFGMDIGYPPGMRIVLFELDLMRSNWFTIPIEDQKPGACCTLIYRSDICFMRRDENW